MTGPAAAAIIKALLSATEGLGLDVRTYEDLTGASVRGGSVEAYVVTADTGFQVEIWRENGRHPFRIDRARNDTKPVPASGCHRRRCGLPASS